MYLIYYKENKKRTWIKAEKKNLKIALQELYKNPNVEEIYYVSISHKWKEYNGQEITI